MKTKHFWLSFDCDGSDSANYKELYAWLEEHNAQECGNSAAFIDNYLYKDDFIKEVSASLNKIPHVKKIYICAEDDTDGRFYGRFIKGSRNMNQWHGYKNA